VPKLRLTLEYDGRDFAGWQLQAAGQRTVQGTLEDALRRVSGQVVRVTGAGRTDAGVHAEGQVACVVLDTAVELDALARSLNGVLPPDLAVVELAPAPDGFHPRHDAHFKLYRYRVWNGARRSPLRAERSHWIRAPLDLAGMRCAAKSLVGRHDFSAFRTAGADQRSTVRTLSSLEIEGESRGEVRMLVEADGFLRHMVRILAGTLIEVGRGRRHADSVPDLLASRDRTRAGPTAPARALTLVRVSY
jgi:tRNA pseudouridine38-40 synthase